MRLFISVFTFSLLYTISYAQPSRTVGYETLLEVAEESLAINDYVNAIEYYNQAYKESKDKDLALNVAQLSFLIRDYEKAAKGYERVLSRDKNNVYKEDRLMYAKSLKALGQYRESLDAYQQFINETEDMEMKAVAKKDVAGILKLSEYEENISTVLEFMDRKVNSGSAESGPEKGMDGKLYYSSFMRKDVITLDGEEEDYHAKIYSVGKDEEGELEKAVALGEVVNREGYHSSHPTFSNDGNEMYFTRTILEGNDIVESKLFVSFLGGNGWGPAQELNINGEFNIKNPSTGELFGSEVIFFSSDMAGGSGGYDIYYATKNNDGFASPVNLGAIINTTDDEVSPYYIDGTMYFSSDGHPSMGGYDIFYSAWNGSAWAAPANMGFVYNSPQDDLDFTLNRDGSGGYLVSNRLHKNKKRLKSKTCCDDIYAFTIRELVIDLLASVTNLEGEPLTEATIDLIDTTMDRDTTSKTNLAEHEFNFLLDSEHTYTAEVKRDGYYPKTIEFNTVGIIDDYTVSKTIALEPIPVKVEPVKPTKPEPVVEVVKRNEAIRLNNIYYDYDDDKILTDAEIDLNVILNLMNQYPDMVIELSSHTDSRGVSKYNENLSQRRADSAKSWLVERGIATERIQPVGYGEAVILNQCVNGVRCSDDEHRVNRRTEFKMISGPDTIEIIRGN